MKKSYFINSKHICALSCPECKIIQAIRKKTKNFTEELSVIKSYGYQNVTLSCQLFENLSEAILYLKQLDQLNLESITIQVSARTNQDLFNEKIMKIAHHNFKTKVVLQWVFLDMDQLPFIIKTVRKQCLFKQNALLLGYKKNFSNKNLLIAKGIFSCLFVQFPYRKKFYYPDVPNTKEIYQLLMAHPEIAVSQHYTYGLNFPHDEDYERITSEVLTRKEESLDLSFIIPSYNSSNSLKKTLMCLLQQNYNKHKYEIIVVDDGSSKKEMLKNISLINRLNDSRISYTYYPRKCRRTRGDFLFRAGSARNLGALLAKGDIFCFIDSDILIDQNYSNVLIEKHKNYDLIQPVRHHLSKNETNIQQIFPIKQLRARNNYWENFYLNTTDWNALKTPWKYVSTYCLSVKKDKFWRLGGFAPIFHKYGFEDTDFGYRAYKENWSFLLLQNIVAHSPPALKESEFFHSNLIKELSLAYSAKIFYLNHLDPKIFENLSFYLQGPMLRIKIKMKINEVTQRVTSFLGRFLRN